MGIILKYDAEKMLSMMNKLLEVELWKYVNRDAKLTLPVFSEPLIIHMLDNIKDIFSKESIILHVQTPINVIGDLHGNLLDLLTILNNFGKPPHSRYLFLGDLIDRGEFSIDTIVYIYLLKICYPNDVFIIRGNHEHHSVCFRFGFRTEIRNRYGSNNLFPYFVRAFDQTPLCALIDSHILCLHGGIGPNSKTLKDIASVERPLHKFDETSPAYDLLWSDPCDTAETFMESPRGFGFLFGPNHLSRFLKRNKISLIIRGHEVAMSGIYYGFDGKIITVFSASNYCNMSNYGGILRLEQNNKILLYNHKPYDTQISRQDAEYKNVGPIPTISESPPLPLPKVRRKAYSATGDSIRSGIKANHVEDFPESAADLVSSLQVAKTPRRRPILPTPNASKSVISDSVVQQTPSVIDNIAEPIKYRQKPIKSLKRSKSVKGRKRRIKKNSVRSSSPQPVASNEVADALISAQIKATPKKKKIRTRKNAKKLLNEEKV